MREGRGGLRVAVLPEAGAELMAAELVYWYCSACDMSGRTPTKPATCPGCGEPL